VTAQIEEVAGIVGSEGVSADRSPRQFVEISSQAIANGDGGGSWW